MISKSKITGLAAYLPNEALTNFDLEKRIDTSNDWIIKRTGIKERRLAAKNEFASDMAIKAVEKLIATNKVTITDVEMIIVTTFTPDHFTPSIAALVEGHFNIKTTGSFDISAGCTGFVYGLNVADSLIASGNYNKILLISAESISKVVDYEDRSSCILFGDASVAFLLERTEDEGMIIAADFTTDGELASSVTCTNLSDTVNGHKVERKRIFEQDGQSVYKYVVKTVPKRIEALVKKAGLSLEDINWFIPHSANMRIIEAICQRLKFPLEKTLTSLEYYGNTSSATIPLAFWLAKNEGKIKKGDIILLYGFGGGLTQGGVLIKY